MSSLPDLLGHLSDAPSQLNSDGIHSEALTWLISLGPIESHVRDVQVAIFGLFGTQLLMLSHRVF
jgi:hypothetical protein